MKKELDDSIIGLIKNAAKSAEDINRSFKVSDVTTVSDEPIPWDIKPDEDTYAGAQAEQTYNKTSESEEHTDWAIIADVDLGRFEEASKAALSAESYRDWAVLTDDEESITEKAKKRKSELKVDGTLDNTSALRLDAELNAKLEKLSLLEAEIAIKEEEYKKRVADIEAKSEEDQEMQVNASPSRSLNFLEGSWRQVSHKVHGQNFIEHFISRKFEGVKDFELKDFSVVYYFKPHVYTRSMIIECVVDSAEYSYNAKTVSSYVLNDDESLSVALENGYIYEKHGNEAILKELDAGAEIVRLEIGFDGDAVLIEDKVSKDVRALERT